MSTDRYDPLLTRILACLYLMKQDALSGKGSCHSFHAFRSSTLEWTEYNSWSYLALKNGSWDNMVEPPLAFPPATRRQLRETERKPGFPLLPLLRLLYEHVGNGRFGPCYGIVGGVGGFPFQNRRRYHIAAVSLEYRRWYSSIRLEDCQQMTIEAWEQARQAIWGSHLRNGKMTAHVLLCPFHLFCNRTDRSELPLRGHERRRLQPDSC